jgi:3-phenylpropionate/trans-cinnamate dioxygenase ferredoxin reductase component
VSGVVIVGGGQGGYQAAASLRAEGYQEPITILGEEPHLPYQRPPLSKGMLLGKQEERHAILRPAEFYQTQRIELVTGQRVESLDSLPPHDWVILATGARNRELQIPGSERVVYLRSLKEAATVKERLADAQDVAVIGGGFIGLEVAAAARALGKAVTVYEAGPRLMGRVVAPVISDYFREQHEARGVRVVLNASVVNIADIPADLVVVGIGVVPNDELAREAGLAVGNGIAVNEFLETSNPKIFAIGDCAEYPNPYAGARVRLESVQNAVDQALSVAKTITGKRAAYDAAPWFWSDQFDIHLQMAGVALSFDQTVTRGDPATGKFSVFYYDQGVLKAVNSINRAAEHLTSRKLIAARAQVTPEQAADESFDLKSAILPK